MNRKTLGLNRMMKIGLLFLVVASASRWFLHPSTALFEQRADGMMGFLYGIAISCLLLGIWRRGRGGSTPCG